MRGKQQARTPAGKLGLGPVGAALNISGSYLDEAAELEELGYRALWLPGGQIDRLGRLADLALATRTIPVGSAIIPLDVYRPGPVAELYAQLEASAPGRLMVGLGGPQQPRPLRALNDYLDQLDHGQPPVPAGRRLLAALGPRKLELARDRAAGALLLLVTPAYISAARRLLGEDSTLVIAQMLVLDTDATRARETARRPLQFLSGLRGYRDSFTRMGFSQNEVAELSDRLVDALVAWGDPETIAARVRQHLDAGADHVMLHTLTDAGQPGPIEAARQLAGPLLG
jgi:probable F420-dependent oxidoreductase